jgi:hypothetical protein
MEARYEKVTDTSMGARYDPGMIQVTDTSMEAR